MGIITAIQDFALANPAYAGATVNFFTVDPVTLLPTAVLAPLFIDQLGQNAVANPQVLDGYGKFAQPIYCGVPVIAQVNGGNAPSHATGIIFPEGSFRGTWATATVYYPGDTVKDGAAGANTGNIYDVLVLHTSGVWAADLAAVAPQKLALLVSQLTGTPVSLAMTPVVGAATLAAARAAEGFTLSDGAGGLAATPGFLRDNGAGAIDERTILQARGDLGVPFAAILKPVATPYNMLAADVGKLISSESMGGAGVVNLIAGATAGVNGSVSFFKLTNQLTINTNGADRIQGLPGGASLASLVLYGDGDTITLTWDGAAWKPSALAPAMLQQGQCRLTLIAANVTLKPYNGGRVYIPGTGPYSIPAAGLGVAVGAALVEGGVPAVGTSYFVYLSAANGLQLSATGHSTDAATGFEIRTGDNTRLFVGIASVVAGPAFVDSGTQIGVISWFSRLDKAITVPFTASATTTSTTYVEINSAFRAPFVCFGDEPAKVALGGWAANNTGSATTQTTVGFDGVVAEDVASQMQAFAAGAAGAMALSHSKLLAEGAHYATLLGLVSGGTGTWVGNAAAGQRVTLKVTVRG